MYKIFIPLSKGKKKSPTRGFWRDNVTGKIYYDYIFEKLSRFNYKNDLNSSIEFLRVQLKQEAIFYEDIQGKKAFIQYAQGKRDVLTKSLILTRKKNFRGLKVYIVRLLKKYGGFSVCLNKNQYIFKIWQA